MHIFIEIGILLGIATIMSIFMRMLRQPLIVGYIATGVIAGPYFLNIITSTEYIELFSKLGIAILLFIVGLSLKPDVIREVGKTSLVTGIGQVVFTSLIGFGIMQALGFDKISSLYGAVALTFSSTIIILKLLSDKGDLEKLYGKISVGFLLVQDIIATIILLVVSFFGSHGGVGLREGVISFAIGIGFFVVLYVLSRFFIPGFSSFLAKSQEALFLFSITWGLGMAALFYDLGFSLEIGALIAGVTLSISPYAAEISSRMKPLRDFFILLFFVMLGSQMIIADVANSLMPAAILSAFILIGNPIIVIILMNLLGYKTRTGFMAGLTVAQISEFSLILIALGFSLGHLSQQVVSLITLVGIVTIAGSTYLILYADKIYPYLKRVLKIFEIRKHPTEASDKSTGSYDMVIFGYDRVGYDFVSTAQKADTKYVVVDFNPKSIKKLIEESIPCMFGDAEDIDFLEDLHLKSSGLVISTIPDLKTNLGLVSYYHNHNPKGIIIVTSHDIGSAKELYAKGASFVVMPHYLGAKYASSMLKAHLSDKYDFDQEREKHLEYLEKRHKHTK